MTQLTTNKTRKIIDDFAEEIVNKRTQDGVQPKEDVIDFRDERAKNVSRPVYKIPTDILKFRKENGRIAPEVINYEQEHAPIDEETAEGQEILRVFLSKQDKNAKDKLKALIRSDGQKDPAIITADGFLINGNRRKMALEELFEETNDHRYKTMLAVILPNKDDMGGPPTVAEIEEIENRYQLYKDGKAEYSNFAKALSYRNKIERGVSLKHQVLGDPEFRNASNKVIQKRINEIEKDFLGPLTAVDEYLDHFHIPKQYRLIGDRWQAFIDYYKSVETKITDEKWRATFDFPDELIGDVKDLAFKMIRQREFKNEGKLNDLMRQLPRLLQNQDSRNHLLNLVGVPRQTDEDGGELDYKERERKWKLDNQTEVIRHVHNARQTASISGQKQKPIDLLEQAFNKLTHDEMDLEGIMIKDTQIARKKIVEIRSALDKLEHNLYDIEKKIKKTKDGIKFG